MRVLNDGLGVMFLFVDGGIFHVIVLMEDIQK